MRLRDVDKAMAEGDPLGGTAVAGLPLEGAEEQMLEAIASEPRAPKSPGRRAHRRPVRRRVLVGAAVASLAAIGIVIASSGGGGKSSSAYGATLVRFAESTPLILIGAPGWHVDGVQPSTSTEGEMGFYFGDHPIPDEVVTVEGGEARGIFPAAVRQREADLNWYGPLEISPEERRAAVPSLDTTAKVFRNRVEDRAHSAEVSTTAPVLDTTARVFQYEGGSPGDRDIAALWVEGGLVREFRSQVPSMVVFKERLATLEKVDTTTWLDAMPASVVKSADQPQAVSSMLKGIPLPPGFSAEEIEVEGLTTDRYQLGVRVVSAVACTWFGRWAAARTDGDAAKERQATAAMAGAGQWPILREMSRTGAYTQVVEDLAAAMPSGHVWKQRPLVTDVESALACSRIGIPLTGN